MTLREKLEGLSEKANWRTGEQVIVWDDRLIQALVGVALAAEKADDCSCGLAVALEQLDRVMG